MKITGNAKKVSEYLELVYSEEAAQVSYHLWLHQNAAFSLNGDTKLACRMMYERLNVPNRMKVISEYFEVSERAVNNWIGKATAKRIKEQKSLRKRLLK